MKKTKEIVIVIAVLAAIVLFNGACFGAEPQPTKDLRDFLLQVPNSVYNNYGWSEDTCLFYNLIMIKDKCDAQQVRIEELEKQVAELKELVMIDPNN